MEIPAGTLSIQGQLIQTLSLILRVPPFLAKKQRFSRFYLLSKQLGCFRIYLAQNIPGIRLFIFCLHFLRFNEKLIYAEDTESERINMQIMKTGNNF